MLVRQLHHIADEEEAGGTREARRRGASQEPTEMVQQARCSLCMHELRGTKVKQRDTGLTTPFEVSTLKATLVFHVTLITIFS